MSGGTRVRGTANETAAITKLANFLPLQEAVHRISQQSGIRAEIVQGHLNDAVLDTLEELGEDYVQHMGSAIERVSRLRETVHDYYERALSGQFAGDTTGLRTALERLRDTTKELMAPDVWAEEQHAKRRAEMRAAGGVAPEPPPPDEPVSGTADPLAGVDDFDVDARRPKGEPSTPPAAGTERWDDLRDVRRIAALPDDLRAAFHRAQILAPDLVNAATAGDITAAMALGDRLRHVMNHQAVAAAVHAIAAIRIPDLSYSLGGTLRGSGIEVPVQAAHEALPAAPKDLLHTVRVKNPEFVRTMVLSEIGYREPGGVETPWRQVEMDRFCIANGITPEQRPQLEEALLALNKAHRGTRTAVEAGVGSTPDAQARARVLDEAAQGLGLPTQGQIAEALRGSPLLQDLTARSPDQFLELAGGWLRNSEERAAGGKAPMTLEAYVRILMTRHVRGTLGELTAVFQLGPDAYVLKAPDLRVTDPGTDFVVVLKKSGEVWFCDNKTLSRAGLGKVPSIVENLAENMASDITEIDAKIAALQPPLEPEVVDALARVRTATAAIRSETGALSDEAIAQQSIQDKVTGILDGQRIRRIVTNAGGELTYLTERLERMGVELANLRSRYRPPGFQWVMEDYLTQRRPLTPHPHPPGTAAGAGIASPSTPGAQGGTP